MMLDRITADEKPMEREELGQLEAVIERGQQTFVEVGQALAAIREPRVTGAEPPGALAVRAAILAENGYEEGARNDARILGAKPLLPEERALIAPLLQ